MFQHPDRRVPNGEPEELRKQDQKLPKARRKYRSRGSPSRCGFCWPWCSCLADQHDLGAGPAALLASARLLRPLWTPRSRSRDDDPAITPHIHPRPREESDSASPHGIVIAGFRYLAPPAPARNRAAAPTVDNHQPSTETGAEASGTLGILPAAAHTDRMENWPGRFGLIELRKKTHADQDFWHNKEAYRLLTSEVVIPKAIYDRLPKWERRTALAAAVGLTVDTAVVTGRAAALLWGIKC